MATRAPFLTTRYGAYYHRDVPQEDTALTHVGPGTPGGEYFRRFWQPMCFADDRRELPLRVTILGEELVAFRDLRGQVGLLELHCPHRGTSLAFGLISARGIRCCYHGWLFDVDGTVLETPGEPVHSTLKDRLCHGAYPTHEYNGIVFAYLGPPDKQPPFPIYDSFNRPGYGLIPGQKYFYPCNWLQIADSYEASQRRPGDYKAQLGQRPIAIHGLEHLGATDRGVIMCRQQIRRGMRAVQAGQDPQGLSRDPESIMATYCNDTIVPVPPAPTPQEDQQLMRATGRTMAESYLKQPPLVTANGSPV